MRKFAIILSALAFGLTSLAPATASAQRYRGGHHDGGYYGDYGDAYGCRRDNNYGCERDRDRRRYGRGDSGDAVAAGVIGLVLGAALATTLSNNNNRNRNYDRNYDRDYDPNYDRGYDDGYRGGGDYGEGSYYDGPPPEPQCTRRERQWDRYANRYVMVDVSC